MIKLKEPLTLAECLQLSKTRIRNVFKRIGLRKKKLDFNMSNAYTEEQYDAWDWEADFWECEF